MKKINLKSPKYVLPALILPFILLLFYASRQFFKLEDTPSQTDQLSAQIGKVSADISEKSLADKLQAYKEKYRQSDGYTAITTVEESPSVQQDPASSYNAKERRMLDSIQSSMKRSSLSNPEMSFSSYSAPSRAQRSQKVNPSLSSDRALADALNAISRPQQRPLEREKITQEDPMKLFRAQMSIIDSMGKANDPAYSAKNKKPLSSSADQQGPEVSPLKVSRVKEQIQDNTINTLKSDEGFLPAMIDESITLQSGSRVTIKLLSDIKVSDQLIAKGTLLYAIVSGFSRQRIFLSITSVAFKGKILPIRLEAYDLDGLKGLYVPASAFREFSKDLSTSSVQGISIDGSSEQNKQLISTLGRMFQSTTSALTRLVRQNKAKVRYATQLFLISSEELQKR